MQTPFFIEHDVSLHTTLTCRISIIIILQKSHSWHVPVKWSNTISTSPEHVKNYAIGLGCPLPPLPWVSFFKRRWTCWTVPNRSGLVNIKKIIIFISTIGTILLIQPLSTTSTLIVLSHNDRWVIALIVHSDTVENLGWSSVLAVLLDANDKRLYPHG